MPIGAAVVGAAGSIGGALISSSGSKQAAQAQQQGTDTATAEASRQFDIGQANQAPWLTTGASALGKLASLYGLQTAPLGAGGAGTQGAADEAATLAKIKQVAQSWEAAIPGNGRGVIQAIDAGESLAAVQARMNSLRQTTTNPSNTAYLDQMISQAANPIRAQPAQTQPGTTDPNAPGYDKFGDFYKSPDYQFRLNEGLKAGTAAAALGRGGGLDSGAAIKAATTYAGNLAAGEFNTYANRLQALAGVGQTTATNTANQGADYANQVGNLAIQRGNNQASAYQTQANATGNLVNTVGNIGSGLIQNNPSWFSSSTPAMATYNTTTGNWTPGPGGF